MNIFCGHQGQHNEPAVCVVIGSEQQKESTGCLVCRGQWRIYIVKFWTRAPPLGVQILSISCSFREKLAKSYVGAPPWGVGAPSSGKSWIRHWGCLVCQGVAKADRICKVSDCSVYLMINSTQLIRRRCFRSLETLC